jgi:hypothetical protein
MLRLNASGNYSASISWITMDRVSVRLGIAAVLGLAACRSAPAVKEPPKEEACAAEMDWCRAWPAELTDSSYVICIDARSGPPHRARTVQDVTSGFTTVLPVNRALDVKVVYDAEAYKNVTIKLGGTAVAGHTIPATYDGTNAAGTKAETRTALAPENKLLYTPPEAKCAVTEARFPPRTPGTAVLTLVATPQKAAKTVRAFFSVQEETVVEPAASAKPVSFLDWIAGFGGARNTSLELVEQIKKHTTADGKKTSTTETTEKFQPKAPPAPKEEKEAKEQEFDLEFVVPRIYSGALRVGIAGIGFATNHGYTVRKRQGSEMGEIVDLGQARVDPEVVLGYALFPQALTRSEGRDYLRKYKPQYFWHKLGFYVGVGIVGASSSTSYKAEFFRSLHIGLELELAENLSIALTTVLRRPDDLASGYHVGDPVEVGTSVTAPRYHTGLGIVANFSFDFFRLTGTVGAKP